MASINDVTPEEWDALTDKERYYDNRAYPKEVKSVTEPDPVNSPAHYRVAEIEAIDYISGQLGSGVKNYLEGNILKYMHRWRYKNGVEDLRKAKWYLDKLIFEEVQGG
jgi:hypothetical protein